jgi:predicted nucleic acid-binding protein
VIDFGEDLYPPDIFGALWNNFEQALGSGDLIVAKIVLAEMRKVPNPPAWHQRVHALAGPHAASEARPTVQAVFQRLVANVAMGQLSTKLSDNDLLILSCAEIDGLPIVTRDTKMRQACDRGLVNATHVDIKDVFRTFGWQF